MGWILLWWGLIAIFGFIFTQTEKLAAEAPKNSKEHKRFEIASNVALGIAIFIGALPILYLIGWVWYYFCSGFLIFENQPFIDKVFCGFLSIAMLILVFGGIAVIFGKGK